MPNATMTPDESTAPIVTIAGGRATIRLNRARERNRIEPDDLAILHQAFTRIDQDRDIRVLVLTGTDQTFSSGYHAAAQVERRAVPRFGLGKIDESSSDEFERTVDELAALRVPTIAALNGSVYGGSTDLALACDFRIGVEGMRLLMPVARLGVVFHPSGIERYVVRLGVAAAKKLFLTAQPIDSPELLRIGYLDECVPAPELLARADALAETLAGNAPLALAALKRAINEIVGGRLDRPALATARARCEASQDHAEALKAWNDKRAPVFRGL